MKFEDHPITAKLRFPPKVLIPTLGAPIQISAGELPIKALSKIPVSGTLHQSSAALVSIIKNPTDVYLLIAWDRTANNQSEADRLSRHNKLLTSTELHPHTRIWMGTSSLELRWRRPSRLNYLRTTLSRTLMDNLWEQLGDPENEARWLSTLLRPRSLGAALRTHHPGTTHHLWLKLN